MDYSTDGEYLTELNISSFGIVKHMNVTYENFIRNGWAANTECWLRYKIYHMFE
jgi:hypothetical protein